MLGVFLLPILSQLLTIFVTNCLHIYTNLLASTKRFTFTKNNKLIVCKIKQMKTLLPYLICIVLGLLLARECNKDKTPEIIVRTVTVKVPEIINHFDTIYKPIPRFIYQTDTITLERFLSASDSLKIALYVDATKVREYKEQFKDSAQEINVFTRVRGEMLAQSLDYKIFEQIITHTDSITIKKKRSLYLLPKLGTDFDSKIKASIGLTLIDRKDDLFSIDFDTDKVFWFGMGLKW